jgi:urease accessory protein
MSGMSELAANLRLLAWLSPAFPTGGFAYSHGLEWAVERRDIHDAETLFGWIGDVMRHGSGRNDVILLRHAHRAMGDMAVLGDLCALGLALSPSRERRAEAVGMGNAFVAASRAWNAVVLPGLAARVGDVPYSVAVGALAGVEGVGEDFAASGFLQAFAASLISAAVRLVPLGQTVGLAVLARLEGVLLEVGRESGTAGLDELGGACFRSDIAAMRHETQYSRMFRS